MLLGEKIKQLRHACNLTQGELADRCELSKGFISQLECAVKNFNKEK